MRPLLIAATVSAIPVIVGCYMLFDGMHALLLGQFFGPGIGPWGIIVSSVGVDPASMAAPFVIQGSLWVFFLTAGLYHQAWAWYGRMAIAIGTLWYISFGMILSVVQIGVLLRYRNLLAT